MSGANRSILIGFRQLQRDFHWVRWASFRSMSFLLAFHSVFPFRLCRSVSVDGSWYIDESESDQISGMSTKKPPLNVS